MSLSKAFFTIFLVAVFTGCDPARTLVIKTADKPNLSVTIFGNRAMLPHGNEADTEKVVIKIPPDANYERRDTAFRYGLGGWNIKGLLTELVANIDSVIIITSSGRTVLSTKEGIQSYLRAHQTGYSGSVLTIEAR